MTPLHRFRLVDALLAARDRLVGDSRFRDRASAFAPTRWIARRRARALFDLCAGFTYSQVLAACVRLRLFAVLAAGPQTAETLSARLGLTTDAMRRLLEAAAALRLVGQRRGGRYGLGPLGAPLAGNAAVTAMVEHHAMAYRDLADPVALLRGTHEPTELSRYWPYAQATAPAALERGRVLPYTRLMAASQPLVADQVLAAVPLHRYRCLLDVGGGDGTFVAAAAAKAPHLRLMLYDLPAVAERAAARFAAAGLRDRAAAIGGDFHADPLPRGADLITLVRVLHDHDDDAAIALLRAVRAALAPGGRLLVAEPMASTRGADPVGAYFSFYLLAMGRGRPRTPEAVIAMLRAARFASVRMARTRVPMQVRVVVAES